MATKAALAAALLVALVALASATSFTTTVVTTTVDEEANPAQRRCRQQVQGRQFRPCQRYLEQRSSSPYGEEEEEVLEMSTDVRRHRDEPHLEECCQQLREMDRQQCGCEAIKQTLKQAQEEQEGGSQRRYQTGQTERIYQKARNLPRICGLRQQQCRFNLVFV